MFYISLSATFIKNVNNFNKTCWMPSEHAESEYRRFELIKCKFTAVRMNIEQTKYTEIPKSIHKRIRFNDSIGVIGYADSEYKTVNNIW